MTQSAGSANSAGFASQNDLADKTETFSELAPGVYALTAEGDPNSGVIVGDDSVLVIDARATPAMASDLVKQNRRVTDKPIRHVLLTHYHAVRVLGVAGYPDRVNVISSDVTREMIVERGQQDMDSEIQRFPRLFRGKEQIPGLTWPTMTFTGSMSLWLGSREVQIIHAGRGHTRGDTVAWLPKEKVLFAGDLVEFGATPYCGDAHYADWAGTLDQLEALGAEKVVPGRGDALTTPTMIRDGFTGTRGFTSDLFAIARESVAAGKNLSDTYVQAMEQMRPKYGHWVIFEHCMPFDVSRAFDEASGIDHPRIWTAERDLEMWAAVAGQKSA